VFKDTAGMAAASAQEAHVIKGKKVTCKKAEAKQGKIYVDILPSENITVEDIQTHFAQFGPVVEVVRPIDKSKNDEPKVIGRAVPAL
jgi:RNA recognition motif-containing protein